MKVNVKKCIISIDSCIIASNLWWEVTKRV